MAKLGNGRGNMFFDMLRLPHHNMHALEVIALFAQVDQARVQSLASLLAEYIKVNVPAAIERRNGLADYRTNPYVLMTTAKIMDLDDPARFADFLFNNKLYMGLETSFGKSIEAAFVNPYPLHPLTRQRWAEAPEKLLEFKTYEGLSREEKAKRRTDAVWREIDKSCVIENHRYMTSIKSGPNCINDSQVQAMTRAIIDNIGMWMSDTKKTYPHVSELDVVVGITYGTDRTTNNKENQILVKLLDYGFVEEDRVNRPGVLIDSATRSIRVYRRIGKDFWAFIGNPTAPESASFTFLEILLALAKSLTMLMAEADLETKVNARIQALCDALSRMRFPRNSLPEWVRAELSDKELFWFATAMSAFYDVGV